MFQRFAVLLSAAAMVVTMACSQSDPGITTAVKSKFAADDTVKAYQIDVDTQDRVVTLKGTVETAAAKQQAVALARQTEGVHDVVDQLVVNPRETVDADAYEAAQEAREEAREAGESMREAGREAREETREAADKAGNALERAGGALTDAGITTAVKTKFLADTTVKGLNIDVDTEAGVVTLTGPVVSKAESDRAIALARETNGVKRVVSNLKVR